MSIMRRHRACAKARCGGSSRPRRAAVTRDPGLASERFTGVWSGRPGSAWVSGAAGRVLRREGSAWAPSTGASAADSDRSYQRFCGVSANDIWAVRSGQPASLEHWDGAAWTPVASPIAAGEFVPALWGTATDDVWAVVSTLSAGRLMHWDGARWTESWRNPAGAM